MTSTESHIGYVILIVLFGVPAVFNNVPQHALTQAMIVVLGFMVLMYDA